jgi:hypothetical protein
VRAAVKRRYKKGDWLRIPLGGDYDALGVLTRACRSRLFGYFFAVPASHRPTSEELRALRPQDAVAALLFGGAAIEQARWEIVATSLAFNPHDWPFPDFSSRGAFGDTWTRVRYNPETLQIVERRRIDADAAAALPDARFAGAQDVEAFLRRKIGGEDAPLAQTVCEVRSPVGAERLHALEHGGRLQFSTALSASELELLARFIDAHPHVALRVHGFRHGYDAAQLAPFTGLRHLIIDVHLLQHGDSLRRLNTLETVRIGALRTTLDFLEALPDLRVLELRGTRAPLDPVLRLQHLEAFALEATMPLDFRRFASAPRLRALSLGHGEYDLRALDAARALRSLHLRALDCAELPQLHRLAHLEDLHLEALRNVRDLRPIAQAQSLRRLRISAMPQLNVEDFAPLREGSLRSLDVEIGSRRKEREIYRLMKPGNS